LQRNDLTDVELPLISRNRNFEHNPGVDCRGRLSADMPDGDPNQQQEPKRKHILAFAERLKLKRLPQATAVESC
jgi:hypothetical protein